MTDDRFYKRAGPFALGDIAGQVGGRLASPDAAAIVIYDVADLKTATDGEVALFSDPAFAEAFAESQAGVVVTNEALSVRPHKARALLLSDNPKATFVRIGQLLYPRIPSSGRIHPAATVAPGAKIAADVEIAAGAVIGDGAVIGARSSIGANTVIEDGVVIGEDCRIGPNTSIGHAVIGNKVTISSNTTIGGEGFGFVLGPTGPLKFPQLGRVMIGDNVDIGSNCAIDRGGLGDTVIGAMTALDNQVHIAHNVKIGSFCMITAQVAIAGSSTLGDGIMIGGQAAVSDHLTIGSGARIAGKSGVIRDVAPGESVGGYPAMPTRQWHRQTATLARLARKAPEKE
jgi:UDP-3-O-[3-hydroxymyristoyl] glucosamine N-acyltransferase